MCETVVSTDERITMKNIHGIQKCILDPMCFVDITILHTTQTTYLITYFLSLLTILKVSIAPRVPDPY